MKAKALKDIDFTILKEMAENHIKWRETEDYHDDNDDAHYMYEELMEAVYGSKIWNYVIGLDEKRN